MQGDVEQKDIWNWSCPWVLNLTSRLSGAGSADVPYELIRPLSKNSVHSDDLEIKAKLGILRIDRKPRCRLCRLCSSAFNIIFGVPEESCCTCMPFLDS